MKNHYYLVGTFFGLILALIIGYSIMGKNLWELMFSIEKYNGFIPIMLGALATLATSYIFDKKIKKDSFFIKGLLIPSLIFLSGALIGCLVNSININKEFETGSQFFDYVIKPLFWLTYIGFPASWALGAAYFFANKNLVKTIK